MTGSRYLLRQPAFLCAVVLLTVLCVLLFGATAGASNHYAPNRSGAKEFAVDFCKSNPIGMADFVWLSAPGSENDTTLTVTYPNTVVDVRVNVYTQYCSSYPYQADAGSTYSSSKGGVLGTFYYENEAAGRTWYDSQIKKMNVSQWESGSHTICMTLSSWSAGLKPQPSPSACSVLNLNVVYPWSTSGWSRVGVGNANPNVQTWPANPPADERPAQPGMRLYWRHGIYNNGPSSTGTINFWVGKSGFSNGWNGIRSPESSFSRLGSGGTQEIGYGRDAGRSWDDYSVYDVTQDDVGKTLCQGINWSPANQDGGSGSSQAACVAVPYSFRLTPRAEAPTTTAESGASVTITPSIENSGPTKSYDDTKWQLSRFILASATDAIPADGESGGPCAPSWPRCERLNDGTGAFPSGSTTTLPQSTYVVEDLPLGTRVCFAVSVNKFSAGRGSGKGADDWWNGVPDCMVVGKKPKLQVWGDDVAVRGSINTSTTQKSGGVFGSWVEYAAFSVGQNSNFASGAGLNSNSTTPPTPQLSPSQSVWSKLTFANTDTSEFGKFAFSGSFRQLPSVAAYFAGGISAEPFIGTTLDANTFATGERVVVREKEGNLTLNASTLPKGRSAVVRATGVVTITGNLDYATGALTSLRDIPQLIIIAPAINIEDRVTNVDAWLVASDTINTCSNAPKNASTGKVELTGNSCGAVLTVHGPVLTNKLLLYRTGGSGTGDSSGDPAEVFNLRPDAYLWAQLVATGSGRAETVNVVELPPRF